MNKNNDKINFISFFDEGMVENFIMLYESISRLYDEFTFSIGVNIEAKLEIEKIINDDRLKINIMGSSLKELFKKESLFGNITLFTYARFFANEIIEDKNDISWVYLDPDTLLQSEIPHKYFVPGQNYAFTNFEKKFGRKNQPLKFWEWYLNKKFKKVPLQYKDKIKDVKCSVVRKMKKSNYFNAGVIIINNTNSYFNLCNEILTSGKNILQFLDDQTLLNFFNNKHIEVLTDKTMNFKVGKSLDYNDDVSIVHFLGPQKHVMKRIYNKSNFEFELLNIKRLNLLNYTIVLSDDHYNNEQIIEHKNDMMLLSDFSIEKIKTEFVIFVREYVELEAFLNKVNSLVVNRGRETLIFNLNNKGEFDVAINKCFFENFEYDFEDFESIVSKSIEKFGETRIKANLNLKY